MCGRYVLAWRPGIVRSRLADNGMPTNDVPGDDEVRDSYNFAPGYYGLVYREDVPDYGARRPQEQDGNVQQDEDDTAGDDEPAKNTDKIEPQYKLQAMKWGLIPFWTKRNPDYGSLMRTINCRDDSLSTKGGMWQTMKQRKRCIVIAQGFYEWLKKNNGKEKVPHYIKRKDGELMCMAGLWDCVQYEDSQEKLYSYTIITTEANKQMGFLHDRMPVILENGSKEMFTWLDSKQTEWTSKLQSLLQPYTGELEIYPVSKEVGKVGNNSPSFIVPIDSAENKQNIANFFGNQQKQKQNQSSQGKSGKSDVVKVKEEADETKEALADEESKNDENNTPNAETTAVKRRRSDGEGKDVPETKADDEKSPPPKASKVSTVTSPSKAPGTPRKTRASPQKATASPGNSKITAFFGK